MYIFHAGANDLSLDKPDAEIATDIINVAESLKSTHSNVAVSIIVPRVDNFKEKAAEVNKCLVSKCQEKDIPLISHDNIIPEQQKVSVVLHLYIKIMLPFQITSLKFIKEKLKILKIP